MNVDNLYAADIETDGLLDEVTTFHCMVLKNIKTGSFHKFKRGQEKELELFLKQGMTLIMHNGIGYDKPALNKLGIKCDNDVIDSLMISWYLEPERPKHGLESYGVEFGIPKPVVTDWSEQPLHVYLHRCSEDVNIQTSLWKKQIRMLSEIYTSKDSLVKFLEYLSLRATILMLKAKFKWKLDVPKAEALLDEITNLCVTKSKELSEVMPKVPEYKNKNRPKIYYKKNGDLSASAVTWEDFCIEQGISIDTISHKYISSYNEPKPHYVPEVKRWLFDLGWTPQVFEFKRDKKTGDIRQIPQLAFKQDSGIHSKGDMCPDIVRLSKQNPELGALLGYSMLSHRKGFVKGLLNNVDAKGYLVATVQGFTNTLRSKHSAPLANIPSTRAAWGEEIRSLLCCEEGQEIVGSDMSSLEDRIKHHYQFPIDPEYVKTQMDVDFDPHLLIAVTAGLLTEHEMNLFKALKKETPSDWKEAVPTKYIREGFSLDELVTLCTEAKKGAYSFISSVRQVGKGGNYSCQYGARPPTVARSCGVELKVGKIVFDAYWALNWSINTIAKSTTVKKAAGKTWQLNPINGFWYMLKADKDRFSTLAQGSGAYCFDIWIKHMIILAKTKWNSDLPLIGDFHDEVIIRVKKGFRVPVEKMMREAISNANKELKLNRQLDVEVDFGDNYSEIH